MPFLRVVVSFLRSPAGGVVGLCRRRVPGAASDGPSGAWSFVSSGVWLSVLSLVCVVGGCRALRAMGPPACGVSWSVSARCRCVRRALDGVRLLAFLGVWFGLELGFSLSTLFEPQCAVVSGVCNFARALVFLLCWLFVLGLVWAWGFGVSTSYCGLGVWGFLSRLSGCCWASRSGSLTALWTSRTPSPPWPVPRPSGSCVTPPAE